MQDSRGKSVVEALTMGVVALGPGLYSCCTKDDLLHSPNCKETGKDELG